MNTVSQGLLATEVDQLRAKAEQYRLVAEHLFRAADALEGADPTVLLAVPSDSVDAVRWAMKARTLVTIKEAADRLKFPEARIRNWVSNSKIERIDGEQGASMRVVLEEVANAVRQAGPVD